MSRRSDLPGLAWPGLAWQEDQKIVHFGFLDLRQVRLAWSHGELGDCHVSLFWQYNALKPLGWIRGTIQPVDVTKGTLVVVVVVYIAWNLLTMRK